MCVPFGTQQTVLHVLFTCRYGGYGAGAYVIDTPAARSLSRNNADAEVVTNSAPLSLQLSAGQPSIRQAI
jgi:hypothetical protein